MIRGARFASRFGAQLSNLSKSKIGSNYAGWDNWAWAYLHTCKKKFDLQFVKDILLIVLPKSENPNPVTGRIMNNLTCRIQAVVIEEKTRWGRSAVQTEVTSRKKWFFTKSVDVVFRDIRYIWTWGSFLPGGCAVAWLRRLREIPDKGAEWCCCGATAQQSCSWRGCAVQKLVSTVLAVKFDAVTT